MAAGPAGQDRQSRAEIRCDKNDRRRPAPRSAGAGREVISPSPPGEGKEKQGRKRMRYIDAFNHFFPKRYYDALLETPAGAKDLGKRVRGIPALSDIDIRLKVVEMFDDYSQLLSHGLPPMERLWGADKSPEMAVIANDGLAEVVAKHPKHFVGWSALLPMNAPEAAAKEDARELATAANAFQRGTNANGFPLDAPESLPVFETIAKSGKPILL